VGGGAGSLLTMRKVRTCPTAPPSICFLTDWKFASKRRWNPRISCTPFFSASCTGQRARPQPQHRQVCAPLSGAFCESVGADWWSRSEGEGRTWVHWAMALRSFEMGFSQKMCLPRSAAAVICSTWKGVGDLGSKQRVIMRNKPHHLYGIMDGAWCCRLKGLIA
jgi:hypothetical protein